MANSTFLTTFLNTNAQRDGDYAAVNSQRKLPTLITPDGEPLTESVAILLTLDERHRDGGLLPEPGSAARIEALRWLLFIATEIYPLVEINDYPERFSPTPALTSETMAIAREIWRNRWLIIENQIQRDPYFLAQGFSLCDIYIAVVSRWAQQDEWRPAHVPKVERITETVSQRPALVKILNRHRPATQPERFG